VDFAAHTTHMRIPYLLAFIVALTDVAFGQDFQVSESGHTNFAPSMADDSAGNFVVLWTDYRNARGIYGGTGSDGDIYGQRFTSTGTPVAANFRVSDDSAASDISFASQVFPRVAMHSNGAFVVVWVDNRPRGTPADPTVPYDFNIYAQLYDAQGNRLGANFAVNDDTSGAQLNPDIAIHDDGSFVLVWTNVVGSMFQVQAQKFTTSGMKIGSNHTLTITGEQPRIATLRDSKIVVVTTMKAQVFDSLFQPLGNAIPVSEGFEKAIAIGSQGTVFITFSRLRPIFENYLDSDVFVEAFDSTGTRVGGPIKVNDDGTDYDQRAPAIAIEDTNIIILWTDHRNGYQIGVSGCRDIYGQRYNTELSPRGINYKASHENNETAQGFPVVRLINGHIVGVWLDARAGIFYPVDPPKPRLDIWATIADFDNPIEGNIIPCLPPPSERHTLIRIDVYPNPSNKESNLSFEIGRDGYVEINLYDVLGRRVSSIEKATRLSGRYIINLPTGGLANGIYFLQLSLTDSLGSVLRTGTKLIVAR